MKQSTTAQESKHTPNLLQPIKGRLILACILQAIGAAAGVAPFIAVIELGRLVLDDGRVDANAAWWIIGLAIAALFVRIACLMASGALTHLADLDLQLHLRRSIAARLTRAPLGWFDARSAGATKKALQDDIVALHHLVGHAYTNMVAAIVMPVVALAYLIWLNWLLLVAVSVPIVIGVGLYSLQFRGYGEKMKAYNEALADVNASSVEFVQGIAVIKTFGQARKAYRRFIERTDAFVDYFWEWVRGLLVISAASEIVLSPLFALVISLTIGLLLLFAQWVTVFDVLAVAVLAPGLTAPFLTLAYSQNDMMLAKEAERRITDLLDTPVLSKSTAPQLPSGSRVTYEGVSFSYDGKSQVLNGIDLVLDPGTVTALVGPSGSGKSTLARLLPRFWDVTGGRIAIGDVDVREMAAEELYNQVGFVFQHVQLLRSSIAENIALGRPNASKSEVEAAAQAAQIHDRILSLPRGYDSIVDEDAVLSGGEAQRLSIARAILADAPLLVLDEATAFADPDSEAAIQDALSTLVAGRTLLVIAHRLHTITGADQICVMDKGQIVERGKHQELLDLGGLYAQLWSANSAGASKVEAVS